MVWTPNHIGKMQYNQNVFKTNFIKVACYTPFSRGLALVQVKVKIFKICIPHSNLNAGVGQSPDPSEEQATEEEEAEGEEHRREGKQCKKEESTRKHKGVFLSFSDPENILTCL
jgi:hypothetical protein